jgi:hypothetical protein
LCKIVSGDETCCFQYDPESEILERFLEALLRKGPELWPNDWIIHHDSASSYKALSVKQFLAHKSITEMEHPTPLP